MVCFTLCIVDCLTFIIILFSKLCKDESNAFDKSMFDGKQLQAYAENLITTIMMFNH